MKNDPVLVAELEHIKTQLENWRENVGLRCYGAGTDKKLQEVKDYYRDMETRLKKVIELLKEIIGLRIGELPENLEERHRLGEKIKKHSIIDFDTLSDRCRKEKMQPLGYLIGELRSKNVYHPLNEKYPYSGPAEDILDIGFTYMQLRYLYRLSKKIDFPLPINKERAEKAPTPKVVDKMVKMEEKYENGE